MKCTCSTNFNEKKIEELLLKEFNIQLKQYIEECEYKQKNIKSLDLSKEITSLENKLTKLKDLYVKDLIRIEDYEKDYKEYIKQLEILCDQQKKDKEIVVDNNLDALKSILSQDFLQLYNKLSRIEKRRVKRF